MNSTTDLKPVPPAAGTIGRCDWIVLPLLGLLTIAAIAVSMELFARRSFSESQTSLESCLVLNDPANGVHGIPNSVCSEKSLESPSVEFRLDGAGYRSDLDYRHKAPGTYRIVMIGSSLAMGERVALEKTLATLLPRELSRLSGRRIELYNEGMAYGFARNAALRFKDALDAKPDLVLWMLSPLDIEKANFAFAKDSFNKPAVADSSVGSLKDTILKSIRERGGDIVLGQALRHWLYEFQSQKQYIHSCLMRPDETETGYLKKEMSPQWRGFVSEFDTYAADIERQAKAAGVPFVATLAPNRVLAAMISLGEWPAGYDPYQLDRTVRSIIVGHGGTFIDIMPEFRNLVGPEHLYYPLDGHPDADGQGTLAHLVARGLAGGAIRELQNTAVSTPSAARGD